MSMYTRGLLCYQSKANNEVLPAMIFGVYFVFPMCTYCLVVNKTGVNEPGADEISLI